MKKLMLLTILFFSLSAYALNLSVPESVPAGSSFAVLVGIEESNFDEIKVFLGDKQIFIQNMGGPSKDSVYVAFVDVQSDRRVLLLNPLEAGSYTIKAQVLDAGSVVSEKEASLTVFEPMQSSAGESLKHDIELVREELSNVKAANSELSSKIQELQNKLSDFENKISSFESQFANINSSLAENSSAYKSLSASLNELKQSINAANAALAEISSKNSDFNASLSALSTKVNSLEEQQARVATGFVTFGQGMAVASALIIAVLAIAFYLRKKEETQESLFEEPSLGEDKSEEIASALVAEEESRPKGRWAYRGEGAQVEKEERRFSLGDLIKRG